MINTCLVGGGAIMVIIYVDKLIKVSRQQRCNTANIFCPPFFICFSDSRWTLDGLPDEEYLLWEAEAIRVHEQAKAKQHKGSTSNSQSIEDPTSNKCYNPISAPNNKPTMHAAPTPQAAGITAAASVEGDSSITPLCVPPPRRAFKLGAALQSPYVPIEPRRMPFKCSKEVCKVYDAVCMFARRSTRSKSSEYVNSPF